MRCAVIIFLTLMVSNAAALACSPAYLEQPGPRVLGNLCSFVEPAQIGESFAEEVVDLGQSRVAQVVGYSTGCDLDNSVVVTQCDTERTLIIGNDPAQGQPNGGGWLFDVKASFAPGGSLDLTSSLPDLAAKAAYNGQNITWVNHPSDTARRYGDWSNFICACRTFYPDSEGAN